MLDFKTPKLRVLDLADEKAAFCARLLADLGADVVRIENRAGIRPAPSTPAFFSPATTPTNAG